MVSALYARLYWTLLASFCVMGLCLAFAQPLFSVPDEDAHWQTAHYRLERLPWSDGCVPTLIGGRCKKRGGPCAAVPRRDLVCRGDMHIYGGVLTYPGVLLSKLLLPRQTESGLRQAQGVMLGRLLQGLLVALCLVRVGVIVLRARRHGALWLGAFMLSPLVAQQTFAVTSDSAQIAFGACMFAAIVAWERLAWLDLALFTLFGLCATAKPTTLPCILPSLVAGFWFAAQLRSPVPSAWEVCKQLLASLKPRRAPSIQTCMLWSGIALSALTVAFSVLLDARGHVTDPVAPARAINESALRADPWLIVRLAMNQRYSPTDPSSWVSPLGWLDLHVAPVIINSFLRMLVFMLLLELAWLAWQLFQERPSGRSLRQRIAHVLPPLLLGLLGPIFNVLFVCAIMFVLWARAGADSPEGVQFRYFFPAVIVSIGLLSRALDGLVLQSEEVAAPAHPPARWFPSLALAVQVLVLSLTLPYVSRVYVDLAQRYHDGARPRY
jgi:hypothetical protein